MRELIASVTAKGQVTIPSEVRKHLALSSPDKVAFLIDEEGVVQLRPASFDWEDLRGSIAPPPGRENVDLETIAREAMDAEADEIVREMGGL